MSSAAKDTIYIDIDDEITAIIDKVLASKQKIVALVLPKRAAVLQSNVNMKLLKRTADQNGKNLVLITSEASLLPLAGAAGIHVAKTLQSKPELPDVPAYGEVPINVGEDESPKDLEDLDASKPIGVLAGLGTRNKPKADDEETIEVDNDEDLTAAVPLIAGAEKKKKDKKLKIPNFEKFRTRLILAFILLILLIVGWYYAFFVMPKAEVTIKTDSSDVNVNLDLTARTNTDELDKERSIIPATSLDFQKVSSEKVPATGEKDMGTKAGGEVSLKNCTRTDGKVTIPAGTGVSSGSLTFITQDEVVLPASSFTGGGSCTTSVEDVEVIAQNPGDNYNISSGRSFTVSGLAGITGVNDDAMSGGTTRIVKVVAQSDIDSAKEKLQKQDENAAKDELAKQLEEDDYFALRDTISAGETAITTTPNVGDEASEVTVNATVTYNMVGLRKDAMQEVIEDKAKEDIDTERQSILDNGLEDAVVRIGNREPNGDVRLNLQTVVLAGPQLNIDEIKREISGKKRGDVEALIKGRPGIENVEVKYSPFWVYATPKNVEKITINLEKSENADSDQ